MPAQTLDELFRSAGELPNTQLPILCIREEQPEKQAFNIASVRLDKRRAARDRATSSDAPFLYALVFISGFSLAVLSGLWVAVIPVAIASPVIARSVGRVLTKNLERGISRMHRDLDKARVELEERRVRERSIPAVDVALELDSDETRQMRRAHAARAVIFSSEPEFTQAAQANVRASIEMLATLANISDAIANHPDASVGLRHTHQINLTIGGTSVPDLATAKKVTSAWVLDCRRPGSSGPEGVTLDDVEQFWVSLVGFVGGQSDVRGPRATSLRPEQSGPSPLAL